VPRSVVTRDQPYLRIGGSLDSLVPLMVGVCILRLTKNPLFGIKSGWALGARTADQSQVRSKGW
jgi:hypothetical protein